ncbi:MAG: hypothetical protein NC331_16005 [Lachnospiraceae bacterium]|nr:hypothetical protein [Lachnospiraceae bacterium]
MLNKLDCLYIGAQIRKRNFLENFEKDESGVSTFVATVLLILMVVLIGGAVWGFLSGYFTELFEKIKNGSVTMDKGEIKTGY